MSILIFIIVLVALIVVHELGHFFVAKWSGMKVDEFGIGYPPRAAGFTYKGTEYTLNWLPFGGFVKIRGEDESADGVVTPDSFVSKPHLLQALVLVAGILMNIVFAWLLLSLILGIGTTRTLSLSEAARSSDARVAVTSVLPGSPAALSGMLPGDSILKAKRGESEFTGYDSAAFSEFIAKEKENVSITVRRAGTDHMFSVTPATGLVSSEPARPAIGVGIATVGTLPVPLLEAPIEGAKMTYTITVATAAALAQFFLSIFTLTADLSQVSGPVGIVGAVGSASAEGFTSLLFLTAVISINLALINLIPVPALDGGRLLFVLIEAVTRKPIPKNVAGTVNAIGFGFLILLMLVVTVHDLWKVFV